MEEERSGAAADPCADVKREFQSVDFSTFMLSLATEALYFLGIAPHPETGETTSNLPMARHFIDIMAMLAEKTRGNLTDDENKLVETLLYDMRLKFVERCSCCQDSKKA
jgi:hypothetical protein